MEEEKKRKEKRRNGDYDGNDLAEKILSGDQNAHKAECRAQTVEDSDDLFLVESEVDELLVNMSAVGLHGAFSVQDPADDGEKYVEDRDPEDEKGNSEGDE